VYHDGTPLTGSSDSIKALDMHVSIVTDTQAIRNEWQQFETQFSANHTASCWSQAWYAAREGLANSTPYIIVGRDGEGLILFILPLESKQVGPLSILVSPGAGHSTYFAGTFSEKIRNWIQQGFASNFWSQVFMKVDNADALLIEGFSTLKYGEDHPLAHLPLTSAAHCAMQMSIDPDWDKQYEGHFSSKVKSNDRRCERRLLELGNLTYRVAADRLERLELLATMLDQKAVQFSSAKIADPYQDTEIVEFYRQLICFDAEQANSSLYLSALFLDNRPIAVNFGILENGELHGLITSMSNCEAKKFAPGRLLLIRTNQHLSENQIPVHDFGMGEFAYKEHWCDQKIERQSIMIGFNLSGEAYLSTQRLKNKLRMLVNKYPGIKRKLNIARRGAKAIQKS
jgi:CelD/BcsL family acetyltransferase involved in cellulose biosynthesis